MIMKKALLSLSITAGAMVAVATPVTSVAGVGVQLIFAPPPVRYEVVPAPIRGYVWVPGYWDWRSRHQIWVSGRWVREHPGYAYQPNRWFERGGRGHLERADREPARSRDSDRDGVPDRFDRQPNNPYRR